MPSNALTAYEERLKEIDQLLDAHEALVRLRKAEAALGSTGTTDLKAALKAIQHLVNEPGPGRPREVHALNSSAIALLSGHLQGFIADIFNESAGVLLNGSVKDLATLQGAAPTRGNPNEANITKLFCTLGFPDILDGISWQAVSNDSLKKNLKNFNVLRNRIVHGSSETVKKSTVRKFAKLWKNFGRRFDEKLRAEIRGITGTNPW